MHQQCILCQTLRFLKGTQDTIRASKSAVAHAHAKKTPVLVRYSVHQVKLTCKATCKRTQHYWPNFVWVLCVAFVCIPLGSMVRCCVLSGVVTQSLKPIKKLLTMCKLTQQLPTVLSILLGQQLLLRPLARSLRTRVNENTSKMEIFKKAAQVLTY